MNELVGEFECMRHFVRLVYFLIFFVCCTVRHGVVAVCLKVSLKFYVVS